MNDIPVDDDSLPKGFRELTEAEPNPVQTPQSCTNAPQK
jgi:hypothetical protein